MKYLLALIGEEGGFEDASPEEMKAVMDRWDAYGKEAVKNGAYLAGEGLQESSAASTVRLKEGEEPAVTDGPFAESKELIGGFWLWEVNSKEEAVEWASRAPVGDGTIEVRQIAEPGDYGPEIAEASRLSQRPPEQASAE
jgi:hypothetical protein